MALLGWTSHSGEILWVPEWEPSTPLCCCGPWPSFPLDHRGCSSLRPLFLPDHRPLDPVLCPNPAPRAGILRYQDTSHGAIVAQHKTRLGPCSVMRQNPHNAVLHLGHTNGCVTMWTPNIT